MVVGVFNFQTKYLVSRNDRALSKVMYGSLYYLVSNIKHHKNRSKKLNFILTSRPTLSSYSGKHRLINTSLISYSRLTITSLSAHPQTLLIIFQIFSIFLCSNQPFHNTVDNFVQRIICFYNNEVFSLQIIPQARFFSYAMVVINSPRQLCTE